MVKIMLIDSYWIQISYHVYWDFFFQKSFRNVKLYNNFICVRTRASTFPFLCLFTIFQWYCSWVLNNIWFFLICLKLVQQCLLTFYKFRNVLEMFSLCIYLCSYVKKNEILKSLCEFYGLQNCPVIVEIENSLR